VKGVVLPKGEAGGMAERGSEALNQPAWTVPEGVPEVSDCSVVAVLEGSELVLALLGGRNLERGLLR